MSQVSWIGSDFAGFTFGALAFPSAKYSYIEGTNGLEGNPETPALAVGDVIIIAAASIGGGSITADAACTEDFNDTWTDAHNGYTYAGMFCHHIVTAPSGLTLDTVFSNQFDILNIAGMVISGAASTVSYHGAHREGPQYDLGTRDVPYDTDTNFEIEFDPFNFAPGYYHADTITGYYDVGSSSKRVYIHWTQGDPISAWKVNGSMNFSPWATNGVVGSGQNFGPTSGDSHGILIGTLPVESVVRASHRVGRHHRLSVS